MRAGLHTGECEVRRPPSTLPSALTPNQRFVEGLSAWRAARSGTSDQTPTVPLKGEPGDCWHSDMHSPASWGVSVPYPISSSSPA